MTRGPWWGGDGPWWGGGPRIIERSSSPHAAPTKPEIASEDLLVPRPDLGPAAATRIRAGDPIPPHLSERIRRARAQRPRPRRKSARGTG